MDEKSKQDMARSIGTSSAIGAALLLYFGYATLAEPSGTGLFERSALLLYHTLRIGGVAAAVAAVMLWAGLFGALTIDAVVATLIGVCLALSGMGMAVGGGSLFQPAICVLGGLLFIRAGVQSGRLWMREAAERAPPRNSQVNESVPTSPGSDQARREATPSHQAATSGHLRNEALEPPGPKGSQPAATATDAAASSGEPPRGYLASFARKRDGGDNA
jgi:hypothetical protein